MSKAAERSNKMKLGEGAVVCVGGGGGGEGNYIPAATLSPPE